MASPAKKVRKANFSPAEISVLTEIFKENMDILQSKFTNSITNAKKNKIWEEISEAVNAVGVTARSTQEVRDKWKNLQSHAKREFSSFKSEQKKTGGGPAPPNPSEASLKIINMFSDTPSFTGLQGFETDCGASLSNKTGWSVGPETLILEVVSSEAFADETPNSVAEKPDELISKH
ncbi:nuclear apoptosis-inducing factor 1-like [Pocillopora verrucosa]|uniref:nuclear apoptosis-inducing factor 1-like n=1 Tax=Pocillopora verrucosa TaxID=203993 RepID=UPI00333EC06D